MAQQPLLPAQETDQAGRAEQVFAFPTARQPQPNAGHVQDPPTDRRNRYGAVTNELQDGEVTSTNNELRGSDGTNEQRGGEEPQGGDGTSTTNQSQKCMYTV